MKKLLLTIISIIFTVAAYSQQPRIQNTQLILRGNKLFITYDITGTIPLEKVWIEVTKPDGTTITPNTVTGDIGHVTTGSGKKMVWNMAADGYDLGGMEISVKITSEKSIFISDTKGTFTDPRDGKTYKWVRIGRQVWMAENLGATEYSDGTPIPNVTGKREWKKLEADDKGWCYYENDKKNGNKYGVLYSWAAAVNGTASSNNNPSGVQGVCPDGWHLPSNKEWEELAEYISNDNGGYERNGDDWNKIGKHLKDTSGWHSGDNSTDDYGFSGLPGGYRYGFGLFDYIGDYGGWWSSMEYSKRYAWYRILIGNNETLYRFSHNKGVGFSVRCLQD